MLLFLMAEKNAKNCNAMVAENFALKDYFSSFAIR